MEVFNKSAKSKLKSCLIFLMVLSFISTASAIAHAATYYVATTGSDSNPGTEAQPWRTVQHAADTMVAGDTVYIRGGIYNENVQTMNSGNATEGYITFSPYSGENPTIDGTGISASNGFIINHILN